MAVATGWSSWFWSEEFWLPPNTTWEGLTAARNPKFVQFGEMYMCLPIAVILIIIRVIFEKFIASPVVQYLGVKDKIVTLVPNPFCEKVFQTISKQPKHERIEGLSKQLGWSTVQVEKWFRHRRKQSQPSVLTKATETSWRLVVYLVAVICGFAILHKEEWLWQPSLCFKDYQTQVITDNVFYYYLMEMALYVSLVISLCVDVKRKDFWQMTLHHIVTILLLGFSFYAGFFRIGAVIILVHDVADIFLEGAKVFNYAKWELVTIPLFFGFAITFFVTRLVFFPFWVLHAVHGSWDQCGPFQSWYIFQGLLFNLQVLHIYWFWNIAKMFFKLTAAGKIEKDVRSDESSPEEEDDEEEEDEKPAQDGAPRENKKKQ